MSAPDAIIYGAGVALLIAVAVLAFASLAADLWGKRAKIGAALRGRGN